METSKNNKKSMKSFMEIIKSANESTENFWKKKYENHPEIAERRKRREMYKHADKKREKRVIDIDKQIKINKILKRK